MATENAKLGKLQCDPIEIRDRPPWFRLAQWPCVSDLRAKRDVKLAALCKQWIVAAVVWRQSPNPGQNAQPFETVPLHPEPQLPHRFHGAEKINGCDTDEAIGICPAVLCDLVIADHRAAWTVPRAEHSDRDACTIHLGQRVLDGGAVSDHLPGLHRRNDSNIGLPIQSAFGCCIQASMIMWCCLRRTKDRACCAP